MATSQPTTTLQELSIYLNLPVLVMDESSTFSSSQAGDVDKWLDKNDDQIEFNDMEIPDQLLNDCGIRDSPILLPISTESTQLSDMCLISPATELSQSETPKIDKNMNLPKQTNSNTAVLKVKQSKSEILENQVKTGITVEGIKSNGKLVIKLRNKLNTETVSSHYIFPDDGHVCEAIEKQSVISFEKVSLSADWNIFLPCLHGEVGFRLLLCPRGDCRRAFYRLNAAKYHALKHLNLKPFKCEYPKCDWAFYTSFKLKRHIETHEKRKDFVCTHPNCSRQFTTIYNLKWHRRHHHEKPPTLPCTVANCDKLFYTSRDRDNHFKSHERSDAPFKCPISDCNKLFFLVSALTVHERTHCLRKQDLCCSYPNCNKVFKQPCRLKQHQLQHTGQRPFNCTFENCNWSFSSASKLRRHLSTHTNERKFHCTMGSCNKSFLRSEHLRDHTLTHIGQRPFHCTECDVSFTGKSRLHVHNKKMHPSTESRTSCHTNFHPEQSLDGQSSDDLEKAIQSLGVTTDLMLGASLLPEEPLMMLDNENFSTVNLRDLD